MIFELLRLRDRGWLIPRHRRPFAQTYLGELRLDEQHDAQWHRATRIAQLCDTTTGAALPEVLPLYDAVVLRITRELLVLGGVERCEDEKGLRVLECAQTWWLRVPEPAGRDAGAVRRNEGRRQAAQVQAE